MKPYLVRMRHSRRFGWCYWVTDVEGRTWILTHSGNLAGMVDKGYLTHTHGCILLGRKFGWLRGQRAVLISRPTVKAFQNYMKEEPFYLRIIDGGGGF